MDEVKKEDATFKNEFEASQLEVAKLAQERDNYKNMALKWKTKAKEAGVEEEAPDVREVIREELSAFQQTEANRLKALEEKNAELLKALQNKGTVGISSGTSDTDAPKKEEWSADQKAFFEKYKLDPSKVKESIARM